ncbi:DUF6262 family protein [Streptomyces gibsoniae]|uniref:DUF6262 family protein n=1 Tax=Streptomyces gibsoniae TaxID=3075529 RepID=A0ABU2UA88_9ACTN|nr:DUF6262 family protein [Streptomyces sp. DSM 41699]MDT0470144.1 DUF6262 family protein [Streptomyces sp. DSM 41699]
MNRSVEALTTATRRRRERAENAVEKALQEARKTRNPVSVTSITRAADVSTDFIYRHPVLRPQVESLRRARRDAVPDDAHPRDTEAAASTLVRRRTQQLATERRKHREDVAQLQAALAAAHGELLALRRQPQSGFISWP